MRTASFLGLAVALVLTAGDPTPGQPPKGGTKSEEYFLKVRSLINEGKYDLAASQLEAFMASKPGDAVIQKLQEDYGSTVFGNLRGIRRWSDDPAVEKQARANVEALIARARDINDKGIRNETVIRKYVINLGSRDPDVRAYAENEVKRAGTFAVPVMVDVLRGNPDPAIAGGIFHVITQLDAATVGGWLAAFDELAKDDPVKLDANKVAALTAIIAREDRLELTEAAQTDYRPYLWRALARTKDNPGSGLRRVAVSVLNALGYNPADEKRPDDELVALARPFYDHKAKYARVVTNPDPKTGPPAAVPVWLWDPAAGKLQEPREVPLGQAEELFGLRYARWALEINPRSEPAQSLLLALAAERAVERGKFGNLARTDPEVYRLLADAPTVVLLDLLDRGLNGKRPALALAAAQVLGDRANPGASGTASSPTPLLVKALDDPDPRVQFAAANALLRAPGRVDARLYPDVARRIVEILKRAGAADGTSTTGPMGRVLIADPDRQRADAAADLLRGLGFDTETFLTGRDLHRRIARADGFDLLLVDHHIVRPQLYDLVAQLRADLNVGHRPILVVASADEITPPTLDMLVLRLAILIAATDPVPVRAPPPFVPNITRPPEEQERERRDAQLARDSVFQRTVLGSPEKDPRTGEYVDPGRLRRLLTILNTVGLELTPVQKDMVRLRAELATYTALAAEHPVTPVSAPETVALIARTRKMMEAMPPTPPYTRGIGIPELTARIGRLEQDVAKVPELQARYEKMLEQIRPEDLGLTVSTTRNLAAEERLTRAMRQFAGVRVIPEPLSPYGFQRDLRAAFADPADVPRDPAEKRATAAAAIEWMRKIAIGEMPGFPLTGDREAERVLRDALKMPDSAEAAIDALTRFGTAEAERALIDFALSGPGGPAAPKSDDPRTIAMRLSAADAAVRHVQLHGNQGNTKMWILPPQLDAIKTAAAQESNPDIRGKIIILNGLLSATPADFVRGLLGHQPSLLRPPPPAAPMPGMPPEPKMPEPKKKE